MADGQMTPDTPQTMTLTAEEVQEFCEPCMCCDPRCTCSHCSVRLRIVATAAELERCKEALADTEGMLHAAQIRGDALHAELAKLRESTAPKHDCEAWRNEGMGCALCHQSASELTGDDLKEYARGYRDAQMAYAAPSVPDREKVEKALDAFNDAVIDHNEASSASKPFTLAEVERTRAEIEALIFPTPDRTGGTDENR